MNYLLLTVQSTINEVIKTPDIQVLETQAQPDIIGWGGILVTVIVGIITCLVTWFVTIRTIKQLKLSYSMKTYPILSNAINIHNPSQADGFKILYRNKLLENPWLLAIDIENIGNKAIENPPIKICTSEDIQIIPGYFEGIPDGYDEVWDIESETQNGCKISLQHINPGQTAHVRFYINKQPQKEFKFECPMADLNLQKNNRYIDKKQSISKSISTYAIINIALSVILCMFLLTTETWRFYIGELLDYTHARVSAGMVILYVVAVLVFTLILNICRLKATTLIIKQHKLFMGIASITMIIISIVLLYLVIYDIFIVMWIHQVITVIITLLLISVSIHVFSIIKS